jgi:catechol 2,3-dioxygenase-like lactoylglutathione lyase family enzyme
LAISHEEGGRAVECGGLVATFPVRYTSGHDRPDDEEGEPTVTIQRMDHVSVVVDDLKAAIAFFVELGMELEGEAPIEGTWVDRVNALDGVRVDIAMMRTPDGHGRLELTKFHTPTAVRAEPENALGNTLGLRSVMFAVDDLDTAVARLRALGAKLIGEVVQYQDSYRLCYVRGPEGIIVALAEQLS